MATVYSIVPIEMLQDPNLWAPTPSGTLDLVSPNATTAWFQLLQTDALGTRRFLPATNAVITLTFMRANQFTMPFFPTAGNNVVQETVQTIVKQATKSTLDPSLFNIALTSTDVQGIRAGTLQVTLINNGATTTWNQNWFVTKTLTNPGC